MRRFFFPLLDNESGGSAGAPAPAAAPAAEPTTTATGAAANPATEGQTIGKVAAASAPPEVFKVKVDGQELEMTKEQLLQYASLGKAGQKRMAEAAEMRRKAEGFIQRAQKDPMAALLDPALGLTKQQVRENFEKWYKTEIIDEEALTPEQKKSRDTEARLKKYEEKEAEENQKKEAEHAAAIEAHHTENFQKQIMTTLDKTGLPKTAWTIGRFAFYMAEEIRNTPAGQKADVPMELIADKVREDHQTHLRAFTQNASPEALLKFLGDDVAKKLRKHDLATLLARKNAVPAPSAPATGEQPPAKPEKRAKQTWASIRRNLGR